MENSKPKLEESARHVYGKEKRWVQKQRDDKETRIAVRGETFGSIEVERKETPEDWTKTKR